MTPMTVLATGPSGPSDELEPLRAAGLAGVAGRPLDARGRAKLRGRAWAQREDRGDFLFGKTVGIVGLGRVGSRVARRLAGWDVRLLASDPYVDPASATALGVTLVDLPTLLAESDVVTLHPSLTDETRRMIGDEQLRAMKPTALLVNTARGEVADEEGRTARRAGART